ncbi:MAG TPA: EamA family transporter, partial [Dongiaceae bacterium]|nr:EamA family transporter [Dongiaceae bacterium]
MTGPAPEVPGGGSLRERAASVLSAAVPPPVMLLLSILSMQLGAAVAVQLFATLGASGVVFFRLAFSALFLAIAARPTLRTIRASQARAIIVLGFAIALMNVPFYLAIARIPLGVASAIQFIGPLIVGLATSRRPRDVLWLAMAAGGIAILSGDIGRALDSIGMIWALLAAAGWAAFILASKWVGRVAAGGSGFALSLAASALFAFPAYAVDPDFGHVDWLSIAGAAVVALLSTALPLSLEFAALKRLPARAYSVLVTLEPVT